jgi:CRP-like cAMP-binding protein
MEPVVLALGGVVYEANRRIEHLLFPTGAVVSLVYTAENGATAEVVLVGKEGVVGMPVLLGGESWPYRATAQVAGEGWRLPAEAAQEEFRRCGAFHLAVLRYTQALLAQISQTAVCNCLHPIEKRLCRWLLLARDRVSSDEILVTQELIAHMLGVRREGVAVAASRLQRAGLIHYARGHIVVRDRAGLEAGTCECYRVIRGEFDRLLGSHAGVGHTQTSAAKEDPSNSSR